MARVTFEKTNIRQDDTKFPQLKLESNEMARIVCIEQVPECQWVHTLRAPKIDKGRAVITVKERRNGEKYEDYEMDFIGRPICLGDEGILADRGVDPQNCPACALAVSGDMVDRPRRRFAMHVLKYATKPGTTDLLPQFNMQLLVWAFTDRTFERLTNFTQEWGSLLQHDLLLGPCTNQLFQQFDINVSGKAEWTASEDRKELAISMFKDNKISDEALAEFCGRRVERSWLLEDLEKIKERWRLVNGDLGAESSSDFAAAAPSLADGLEDLVSTQTGMAAPKADATDEFAGLVADATDDADESPAKPGSSGESLDFNDLMNL